MHIEPGLIAPAKMALAYVTAAGAGAYSLKLAYDTLKERGIASLALRSVVTTAAVSASLKFCRTMPLA